MQTCDKKECLEEVEKGKYEITCAHLTMKTMDLKSFDTWLH